MSTEDTNPYASLRAVTGQSETTHVSNFLEAIPSLRSDALHAALVFHAAGEDTEDPSKVMQTAELFYQFLSDVVDRRVEEHHPHAASDAMRLALSHVVDKGGL